MARFRAFLTDSESEPEETAENAGTVTQPPVKPADASMAEDDSEESDSGSESGSSQRSPKHRKRTGKALVRRKDERNYRGSKSRRSESSTDASMSEEESETGSEDDESPPPNQPQVDPSIISRAQQLGVEPQRMHVMQAALFRTEDGLEGAPARHRALAKSSSLSLSRKHSRDSDGEGLRHDSQQRASFAHDIEPVPYRPSRKYARVDQSDSAVNGNDGAVVDAGLAFGRSFRVGWGPGGTLVHLGALCSPLSTLKTSANSSVVTITKVQIFSSEPEDESEWASKLLSHHLAHTYIEPDDEGIPFANPSLALSFSSFSSLYSLNDKTFEASLFRLGGALFDDLDLRLAETVDDEIRRRVRTLRRRDELSRWLQNVVSPTVEAELREGISSDSSTEVFTWLTGNEVENAVQAAISAGNVKMATLVAQAGGDDDFRAEILSQLRLWKEQRIDAHITEPTRKVYALLAGVIDILEGSGSIPGGARIESCPDAHVSADLDWKRAFGLHLWFGQPINSSIADAFDSYEAAWTEGRYSVAPPLPWYSENTTPSELKKKWNLPSAADNHPDALYSMIRLFSDPSSSLSTILTPLSFNASPIDYRLCWHLYIIMSRCLGVRDFSDRGDTGLRPDPEEHEENRVEGHSPSADLLVNSYALQLEQLGMIQEAVFVLLHIEGSAGRKVAIKNLLNRCAPELSDWTLRGLVGSLKIPLAWVNEAKAIYAFSQNRVYEAFDLYVSAGLWNSAHDLAVLELAPDAVIRQDHELLRTIFGRLSGHSIDGWHLRGKTFLDYANATVRLPDLKENLDENVVPDASEAHELEELTRGVPRLIGILPDVLRDRGEPRHNVALAGMVSDLTTALDQVNSQVLPPSQLRTGIAVEGTRLKHIRALAMDKFLTSIEVS